MKLKFKTMTSKSLPLPFPAHLSDLISKHFCLVHGASASVAQFYPSNNASLFLLSLVWPSVPLVLSCPYIFT